MEIKNKLNNLEGNEAGTSTAMDQEEEIGLNNAAQPTVEEQENANIQNETSDLGPSSIQDPENNTYPSPVQEPEQVDQIQNPETTDIESSIPQAQNEEELDENIGIAETSATEPMFTQSQVDEIAGKVRKETRDKVTKDFFQRYGVNSADELDNLFGDAQRFETIRGEFDEEKKAWSQADIERQNQINELKESVALLSSGIDKNRYEDAKFILRGKGLEVSAENIEAELATHPEWKSEANAEPPHIAEANEQQMPFRKIAQPQEAPQKPATTLNVLGNEAAPEAKSPELSDYQKAMNLFKV